MGIRSGRSKQVNKNKKDGKRLIGLEKKKQKSDPSKNSNYSLKIF